jgi:preprotein translocase SecE subunit
MSAENTTDTKSSRRRRRLAEAEAKSKIESAEDAAEEVDEVEDDEDDSDETTTSRGLTAKKGRPTPGRRNRVEEEEEGNTVTRTVGGVRGYFEDTMEELRKVTWPTREETLRLTGIVLVVTIIASLLLGFISLIFAELVRVGVAQPLLLVGVFVVFVLAVLGFIFYTTRSSGTSY